MTWDDIDYTLGVTKQDTDDLIADMSREDRACAKAIWGDLPWLVKRVVHGPRATRVGFGRCKRTGRMLGASGVYKETLVGDTVMPWILLTEYGREQVSHTMIYREARALIRELKGEGLRLKVTAPRRAKHVRWL